jgi:hypothetical protein
MQQLAASRPSQADQTSSQESKASGLGNGGNRCATAHVPETSFAVNELNLKELHGEAMNAPPEKLIP